jgi:hypothetical protein
MEQFGAERTPIDDSSCALVIGPPGDERVEACKLPVEADELREYVVLGTASFSLLLHHQEGTGYELLHIVPSSSPGAAPGYTIVDSANLVLDDAGGMRYDYSQAPTSLAVDEAVELARRSIAQDLVTAKRIYETRACAERDPAYPTAHALADLERSLADLLTEYEAEPSWDSAASVLLFALSTAWVLQDPDVSCAAGKLSADLVAVFGTDEDGNGGSSVEGDRSELDAFVDLVSDVLVLIRQRLTTA